MNPIRTVVAPTDLSALARHAVVRACLLAAELGFADQAHFTRAFRALVGEPPAAYVRGNARADAEAR